MSEEILIRQGAPTLAGIKTGSLFPCPCENREALLTDYVTKGQPRFYRLAYSYLKNRADAEDVMQETLLKLYLERKPFRSPEHERYWVVRVAVNESKKLLRSPWRRRTGPLEEAGEPVFDTPQQSELYQHVMGLPPKYRAAVYLYYYEDCSVQEIAAAMGANPSTVQTWLLRAWKQLRRELSDEEEKEGPGYVRPQIVP